MFIRYANDHADNTFKMLYLKRKRIWKLHDIKWIAHSINHIEQSQEKAVWKYNDEEEDEVSKYIKTTSINLMPKDNDNVPILANYDEDTNDKRKQTTKEDKKRRMKSLSAPCLLAIRPFMQGISFPPSTIP